MESIKKLSESIKFVSKTFMVMSFIIALADMYIHNSWGEVLACETLNGMRAMILILVGIIFAILKSAPAYYTQKAQNATDNLDIDKAKEVKAFSEKAIGTSIALIIVVVFYTIHLFPDTVLTIVFLSLLSVSIMLLGMFFSIKKQMNRIINNPRH